MQPPTNPPASLDDLMQRVVQIAGFSLGELASQAGLKAPANLRRHKGWVGQLIELWLGAEAGSQQTQDFAQLGVELKTLPVDENGSPLETTYVCYAHLTGIAGLNWQQSNVRNKLSRVLWIPVQGSRDIPPALRVVGSGFLWQPNNDEEQALRSDWEEIMDFISLGQVEKLTARQGEVMQIRPKAADGRALTDAIGPDGSIIQTRPRGFYLKKSFTKAILQRQFNE